MISSREGQFGSSSTDISGFAHSPSPEVHDSADTNAGEEIDRVAMATKRRNKNVFIVIKFQILENCDEHVTEVLASF